TSKGSYTANSMVLAAGARTAPLLNGLMLPIEVERQAVFWFEPVSAADYREPAFPIWAHEYEPGEICYGFPQLPRGVKASVMHSGETLDDADQVDREVRDDEVEPLQRALGGILPGIAGARVVGRDVCLFTNTPDRDFVIDFHPDHPRVIVSSACSGHGFKFASVIGEIHADLAMHGVSRFDLSPFSIKRRALAVT
ncbi:MAG: FAD-dependent oxidoreductase, partial [Gemmatimonadaceae bacterium]